jgi:hypothetical protein
LFKAVAFAGIVKEHFKRSSPNIPIGALTKMRVLRRLAI